MFLGMAISSRFLLNFREGTFAEILSFVLLFSLFSALVYWLKQYRQLLPDNKLTFKLLISFTFHLFIIAAVFSSIVKFVTFTYFKQLEFQMMINETLDFMKKDAGYSKEMIQQSASYLTPMSFAIMSGILNVIAGLLMGLMVWPLFKKEQEIFSK